MKKEELFEKVARVAHEANRAYCQGMGDYSHQSWDASPLWQRESIIAGIKAIVENNASPATAHGLWMERKLAEGWVYGEVKDVDKKIHNCLLPYEKLPIEQKVKDELFRAIVFTVYWPQVKK